ncbi:MAG: hypothetical protein WCY21_05200 [Candidatus Cloacimonadaceae bacterium]|nr:hypothetical protein [Candidatus Cloacimonadota bacterium]MDX9949627.1 hypothetical protein [Candidatus Syntrophosphaera sp.]
MPRKLNIETVRGRMPVRYRVPVVSRVLGISAHLLISGYFIWLLFTKITQESPYMLKILPILALFVSLDALLRHFSSLNSVVFTPECVWFRYLLLPSRAVEYENIKTMELRKVITYYMFLTYTDQRGKVRVLKNPASFPKMIEIMYNIFDLAPQVQLDPELQKMMNTVHRLKNSQEEETQ